MTSVSPETLARLSIEELKLIDTARSYAKEAHASIHQTRKYTDEPYNVHTDEVTNIVLEAGESGVVAVAASLHDVKEDVSLRNPHYSDFHLLNIFGSEVYGLVVQLSNVYTAGAYPHLNRAERKVLEAARYNYVSPQAKTIKTADVISNRRDIVRHDPTFAVGYLREATHLLRSLVGGNQSLLLTAVGVIDSGIDELNQLRKQEEELQPA